jgi:hypothetical protein
MRSRSLVISDLLQSLNILKLRTKPQALTLPRSGLVQV